MKHLYLPLYIMLVGILTGCSGNSGDTREAETTDSISTAATTAPIFDSDSAYAYVKRQVDFGPRVPGSQGHKACEQWLAETLQSLGADTVIEQRTTVTAYNGDRLPINNIMGRFNTATSNRVLLVAHYDTRPWADNDPDASNRSKPILGANDGASGVGVLLEIARLAGINPPVGTGIDILFIDAEDYGSEGGAEDSWCLGTQHWTANMPYTLSTTPRYGILLDMVGGHGARFHREPVSQHFAPAIVDMVWAEGAKAGYADRFINEAGAAVVDDHLFLNRAGIPTIDIIEAVSTTTGTFPAHWHTLDDNMDAIDAATLKAVGQTVVNTIYK